MYAAGKRETRSPDRLIDHLLQPTKTTMSPPTTMSDTPTKAVTTVSQAGVTSGNVNLPTNNTETTLADLIAIMNGHANDHAQRFDRLEYKFSNFTKRQDAVESRVDKVEKNVGILNRNLAEHRSAATKSEDKLAKVYADVDTLKETVQQIQANLNVPPTHSTYQAQTFQPIQ